MRFSDLHGKRVAVVIEREQGRTVCRGTAYVDFDDELGPCLRIAIPEQPGGLCFLFAESPNSCEVLPDLHYGCDYVVPL